MTDSQSLLEEYAKTGSESAFRQLVTRYIGLVYSTALRLVGRDTHRAEDVTQMVFIDLARKAPSLSSGVALGGWLHHRTYNIAAPMMRAERRRQAREKEAVQMNRLLDESDTAVAQLAPILDEVIRQLRKEDRTAIILRFFERLDFRSIGQALGTNDDAAQKQVTRAVEKLHLLLKERGVTLSAAAIGTALAGEILTAAPAGLATTVAGTALASVATGSGFTLTLFKFMTMTKVKLAVASLIAIAGVATPLVIQNRSEARLHQENQLLRRQIDELAQMATENERLSNQVAQASSSQADLLRELLRLRGEVGPLRQQSKELASLQENNRQLRARPPVIQGQMVTQRSPEDEARGACLNNLRQIDGAIQTYALENKLTEDDIVTAERIRPYLKRPEEVLRCPVGGTYTFGRPKDIPSCSIPGHALPR
jgi:RNA polymerase sigma factor (sigma-70 family)